MPFCMITGSAKEVVELPKECGFLIFSEETIDAYKSNLVATERTQTLHSPLVAGNPSITWCAALTAHMNFTHVKNSRPTTGGETVRAKPRACERTCCGHVERLDLIKRLERLRRAKVLAEEPGTVTGGDSDSDASPVFQTGFFQRCLSRILSRC
jgi:hypothetical protein